MHRILPTLWPKYVWCIPDLIYKITNTFPINPLPMCRTTTISRFAETITHLLAGLVHKIKSLEMCGPTKKIRKFLRDVVFSRSLLSGVVITPDDRLPVYHNGRYA